MGKDDSKKSSMVKLILGIIAAAVAVVVPLIQFQPWKASADQDAVYIAGSVIDNSDNKIHIRGATISINGRTENNVTEDNGNFKIRLKNLPPKEDIRLHVSKPGYENTDISVTPPVENLSIPLTRKR